MEVDVFDPWADPGEVMHEYGIKIINGKTKQSIEKYSAIILAVAHKEFKNWDLKKSDKQVIFDVKSFLPKESVDARL
jgi:UDP-N-acetyl-D-galactosamine dehydrogenase